jgi:hypothetical protein
MLNDKVCAMSRGQQIGPPLRALQSESKGLPLFRLLPLVMHAGASARWSTGPRITRNRGHLSQSTQNEGPA